MKDSKDAKAKVVPGHFASNSQTVSVNAVNPSNDDPTVSINEATLNATATGPASVTLEATVAEATGDDINAT